MHFRWSTKAYTFLRPVFGHRAAMWVSDMLPVALFILVPLLMFLAIAALPSRNDGSGSGTCGSGAGQYDC